ncbi:hypothetical protein [Clostridium saccharoperbutylacetonicum]|uniref:hypothetical protein n=1 Tax=Clostridium saccharoperbutylacetonicum TaxID=36745 RepID=UPI000983FBA5|nr:hypothetical protein [Clostridium saccharoperbutylacetonicum]AQR93492.1 hypothetical protein CLSAP_07980 [Clostridium saccharoperbutylacetonicum]NSB29190.1 hypothetical protein [Clostridium saccharoperbutylacetonicum]
MKVKYDEYLTMIYEINGVTYTAEATFSSEEIDGEIKHFAEITKTAEENYKSIISQSLKISETEQLKQQLLETQAQLTDLKEQILLKDGGK